MTNSPPRPATFSCSNAVLLLLLLLVVASSFVHHIPSVPTQRLRPPPHPATDIAYFIQIVPSTLPHLPRLFRRVYHPGNVYALHFDVKIPTSDVKRFVARLQRLVPTFHRNTHIVPPDVIVYNGVSMILNTLAAITFLLDVPQQWTFFINLSGSDYPLTDAYLPRQLLVQAVPYSAIFFSLAGSASWLPRFRIRARHIFLDPSLTHATDGNPPLIQTEMRNPIYNNMSFTPVHAEAWMILPRCFCHYVINSPTARRMLLSLANMRGSDEYFFSSLAYNHPVFNRSIVPHSFRKIIWSRDGVHAGQHPYYVDELDNDKWVFLDELRESPQWHARKFRLNDSQLMDHIDTMANDPERVTLLRLEFQRVIERLRERYTANDKDVGELNKLFDTGRATRQYLVDSLLNQWRSSDRRSR